MGVVLCILAVVPLFLAAGLELGDFVLCLMICLLLVLVAVGVYILVRVCTVMGGYQKLLQQGEYTREKKALNRKSGLSGAYWCIVVALFLAVSFATGAWEKTWIVWPVAAVLYGGIVVFLQAKQKRDI